MSTGDVVDEMEGDITQNLVSANLIQVYVILDHIQDLFMVLNLIAYLDVDHVIVDEETIHGILKIVNIKIDLIEERNVK